MIPAPGQHHDLTRLKRVQSLTSAEMLARGLVILGGTAGVWFGIGLWQVGIWTASYLLSSLGYERQLRRMPDLVGWRGILLVALLEGLVSMHWPVLFHFLWTQGGMGSQVIGMLIIAAAMTNAMGIRSEDPLLRRSDIALVAVLLGQTVTMVALSGHGPVETLVVGTVCALLLAWVVISLREVSATRQRLHQAEREMMERQRIEAMGRLTGGVAHDFNNILTVIGGNLDLAAETADRAEREALLAEARRATDRAAGVTAQLLAYSRQSVLAPEEIDVARVLDRVRDFLQRPLPVTVDLGFRVEPALPRLQLDQTRFEAALINLVLNARDAIAEGGRIDVIARLCETIDQGPDGSRSGNPAKGRFLCIAVRDTGSGIAPEMLSKVVEPYFTTKPVGRGSGLGLSMAKGFAEQSGGALHITSTLGQGTEVRMYFPVRPAPESDAGPSPGTSPGPAG